MSGLLNNLNITVGIGRDRSLWELLIILLWFFIAGCNSPESERKTADSTLRYSDKSVFIDVKSGNDTNNGDINNPIRTITELNVRMKKDASGVYFHGSQIHDGTIFLDSIIGTDRDPFIVSSYDTGIAIINGGNGEAIHIDHCENILITNLKLKGNGRKSGNTTNGLSIISSNKCKVEMLESEGFQKSGVDAYNCLNIKLSKIKASDNGFSGINVMGSERSLSRHILIKDCHAENNPGDPTILDNHSGNGILIGMSDSVLIDHCTATNNGWDMPRQGNGPVGIWAWESNRVTIQYCISYRNKTSENAKDGGGFDLDGGITNSVIQYCLSYENQGAGYGLFQYSGASDWYNNVIRYCVSINDAVTTEGAGSIFIWNGSNEDDQLNKCLIYNNVFYNSFSPVISYEQSSKHKAFRFSNNIFLGSGQIIVGNNSGSSFIGNVWWNAGNRINFMEFKTLSDWAENTGQEMINDSLAGMQCDPGLKGPFLTELTDPYQLITLTGYLLNPDSPLRNKGLDLDSITGNDISVTDFYGKSVPLGARREPGICEIK